MKALSLFFGVIALGGMFFAKEFGLIWPIIFIIAPGIYLARFFWWVSIQIKRAAEVYYRPEFRKTWE